MAIGTVVCRCLAGALLFGVCAWCHAQAPAAPDPAANEVPLRQTAYVKASGTGAGDQFGTGGTLLGDAVALSADGNTLAVGAPFESSAATGIDGREDDDSMFGAGAVYVFTRDAGRWTQQAYVKASNPGLTDYFGFAVALSADGDTMAVSAYFEASGDSGVHGDQSDDTLPQAGAVYLFARDSGRWSQQAYLKASNTQAGGFENELSGGDQFGFALALAADGNTLAVSAIDEDSGSAGIDGDGGRQFAALGWSGLRVRPIRQHLDPADLCQTHESERRRLFRLRRLPHG